MGQVIYSLDPYMQGPGMDGDWEWYSPKEAPFRVAGLPVFKFSFKGTVVGSIKSSLI